MFQARTLKLTQMLNIFIHVKIPAFLKTICHVCLALPGLRKAKGRDFGAIEILLKLIDTELCFGLASVGYGDVREPPASRVAFWKPGF